MSSPLGQLIPFIHPAIATTAVAAGAIPILLHLINRRRYRRVPWAAMAFLLLAHRKGARRVRIEQWMLLLLRIAVIVLFGLAIARPYLPATALAPLLSSRAHHVLVLDNSLSMSARDSTGAARIDRAKAYARRLVASFPRNDAVSIVTMAAPAEALVAHAAYDRRFVKERVASIRATQRGTDNVGALATVDSILKDSQVAPENRDVFFISDLTAKDWLSGGSSGVSASPTAATLALRATADILADSSVDLNVIHISSGGTENLSVSSLSCETTLVSVQHPMRLLVEVSNFGSVSVRGAVLQIERDGEIIRRQPLPPIAPQASATATITTMLAEPGTHVFEATVTNATSDALPQDDARFLSVEARDAVPVLLVDGRPGASLLDGQVGYLAAALSPGALGRLRGPSFRSGSSTSRRNLVFDPKVVSESELGGEALTDFDVIALCNVQRFSAAQWRRLEAFVTQGGGLFLFGGDLISVENYNSLGFADGAGLVAGRLTRPAGSLAGGQSTELSAEDLSHPIVAPLANHPNSGLFLARVNRFLTMEVDPARAQVVLKYKTDQPALVAGRYGHGKTLFCTTTAGMDWNNLAAKGDFVSLIVGAFSFLTPPQGSHRNLMVGQSLREPLTPLESSLSLRVLTDDGATLDGRLVPDGESLAFAYGPLESAGTWTVAIGNDMRRIAVNLDPSESDLTPVERQDFQKALGRPVQFMEESDEVSESLLAGAAGELAPAIMYLLVLLLMGEMLLALWFGSQRAVES